MAYKAASAVADRTSIDTPHSLSLALNFSIFYYEIPNSPGAYLQVDKSSF